MTAGFGGDPGQGRLGKDAKITIDIDEVGKLIKKYKKLKKYSKSNIFQIKTLNGTEDIISKLLEEAEDIEM